MGDNVEYRNYQEGKWIRGEWTIRIKTVIACGVLGLSEDFQSLYSYKGFLTEC